MKVALSLFGEEISPRFDCCTSIAVLNENDELSEAEHVSFKELGGEERLQLIFHRACEILICGGIRKQDRIRLEAAGIQVVDDLMGEAFLRFREFKQCHNFKQNKANLKQKQGGIMKSFKFNGKTYEVDDQNFLIRYDEWDEDFAVGMAKELLMTSGVTDDHWKIIRYIREEFQKTGICPLVYQTCRANKLKSKTLKNLFPTGYLRGACLLAGITYKNRWINYYGEASPMTGQPKETAPREKTYRIDVYGFLVDANEWDEAFAVNRAIEMNIHMTDKHWQIIHYLRGTFGKNKKVPNVFESCEANQIEIDDLETLFPAGYHRCAVKIAGLPSVFATS
jgi:tRNA 2-thiouridine synthesizing protein E